MYDVDKLKTPQECRTVMQRVRDRNQTDLYNAVFRRLSAAITWAAVFPGRNVGYLFHA